MPSLSLSLLFATALVLRLITQLWLTSRQMRHVAEHRAAVPEAFSSTVQLAAHRTRGRLHAGQGSLRPAHHRFRQRAVVGLNTAGQAEHAERRCSRCRSTAIR